MSASSIEWTDDTWNPVAGCTVLSPGCTNCYAMRMASRMEHFAISVGGAGFEKYKGTTRKSGNRPVWTGKVSLDEAALAIPYNWRKPRKVFVNSMSDLFHDNVPLEFIQRVFKTMRETPRHSYQVLTKRAERLAQLSCEIDWPDNVWMGVSIETDDYVGRADFLRTTGAKVKFLSLEPLLGPLPSLDLSGIHWVIAGGESGPGSRLMKIEWVRDIRDKCVAADVPFHFKQWGAFDADGKKANKKKNGRTLDGRTWDGWPSQAIPGAGANY